MMMKPLVAMACIFALTSVALYFYQDYNDRADALNAAEQQKMSALCPETEPGQKWASMKAMNKTCRAQGYID
jgi:uncharacterized membrane protein YebE (DUF533 family)